MGYSFIGKHFLTQTWHVTKNCCPDLRRFGDGSGDESHCVDSDAIGFSSGVLWRLTPRLADRGGESDLTADGFSMGVQISRPKTCWRTSKRAISTALDASPSCCAAYKAVADMPITRFAGGRCRRVSSN